MKFPGGRYSHHTSPRIITRRGGGDPSPGRFSRVFFVFFCATVVRVFTFCLFFSSPIRSPSTTSTAARDATDAHYATHTYMYVVRARARTGSKTPFDHPVYTTVVYFSRVQSTAAAAVNMDYRLYYGVKSNRLLVVSDRAPGFTKAVKNTLPGVFVVRYKYDASSLDDIICTYATFGTRWARLGTKTLYVVGYTSERDSPTRGRRDNYRDSN